MSSSYADTASRLARVAPQIRPAGVAGDYTKPTARDLTSSYCPDACATPDAVKKFHHRGAELGQSQRHWGIAGDAPPDGDVRYGATAKDGGSIDECLHPGVHNDKMTSLVGEQREKSYTSERRRPLGRTPQPACPVPVPLDGFGVATNKGESTASTLGAMREVQVRHPAGAQVDRGYDWQAVGVDPTQHRFGSTMPKEGSTQEALRSSPQTVLVPKLVKDYRSTVDHEVGKPRTYGFDNPADWDESKCGPVTAGGASVKPSASNGFQTEQPTVKELLTSWAVVEVDAPQRSSDAEDGTFRTSHPGGEGEGRTAMQATVNTVTRTGRDVKALAKLEDEATAKQLIHPCHYVNLGVQSAYFAGGRDLESIRALAAKCGFGMSDAQVEEVFAANEVGGLCGIEQFKNAAFAMGYM